MHENWGSEMTLDVLFWSTKIHVISKVYRHAQQIPCMQQIFSCITRTGNLLEESMLFCSVADPWHSGLDPDPDPRIHASDYMDLDADLDPVVFIIDLQDANNKLFLKNKFFCILLVKGTFTSFFKDKKSKRSHKTVEIKVFLLLLNDRRIRIRSLIHTSD
jgi:hypothetical protein